MRQWIQPAFPVPLEGFWRRKRRGSLRSLGKHICFRENQINLHEKWAMMLCTTLWLGCCGPVSSQTLRDMISSHILWTNRINSLLKPQSLTRGLCLYLPVLTIASDNLFPQCYPQKQNIKYQTFLIGGFIIPRPRHTSGMNECRLYPLTSILVIQLMVCFLLLKHGD